MEQLRTATLLNDQKNVNNSYNNDGNGRESGNEFKHNLIDDRQ